MSAYRSRTTPSALIRLCNSFLENKLFDDIGAPEAELMSDSMQKAGEASSSSSSSMKTQAHVSSSSSSSALNPSAMEDDDEDSEDDDDDSIEWELPPLPSLAAEDIMVRGIYGFLCG